MTDTTPLKTRIAHQRAEIRRLTQELAEWHKLRDPVNLHINLLRGTPAQLTREQFLHLAGAPPK